MWPTMLYVLQVAQLVAAQLAQPPLLTERLLPPSSPLLLTAENREMALRVSEPPHSVHETGSSAWLILRRTSNLH